jgi:hypothetical protein
MWARWAGISELDTKNIQMTLDQTRISHDMHYTSYNKIINMTMKVLKIANKSKYLNVICRISEQGRTVHWIHQRAAHSRSLYIWLFYTVQLFHDI